MAHSTIGKDLGQALRIHFDGITGEPLPAQLVHLIKCLNDKERAGHEAAARPPPPTKPPHQISN